MADAGFTHAAVADISNSATSRGGMLPALAGLAAGLAYAAISVYWAAGGRWLLNTVGISLSQPGQAGHLAVLLAVWGAAAVKAVAAVLPLLAIGVWPRTANGGPRRLARVLTWIEAVILVGYGLVLTASGLLVQAGVIKTAAHADRLAMKWHAYLWDPWFLIWGILVFLALWRSRPSSQGHLPGRHRGQSRVLKHRAGEQLKLAGRSLALRPSEFPSRMSCCSGASAPGHPRAARRARPGA
jgi:hypothetical protein